LTNIIVPRTIHGERKRSSVSSAATAGNYAGKKGGPAPRKERQNSLLGGEEGGEVTRTERDRRGT